MYTEPLKSKEPAEVASAFQLILNRAQGRIKGKTSHGAVKEVTTDNGAEFKGAFTELLESRGIAQSFKESLNTLAIVDSATRTLKSMMAKEMTEQGTDSWYQVLSSVTTAYNTSPHGGIMDAAPNEVKTSSVLQYELEKKGGQDMAHNAKKHEARVEKLSEAGAFRTMQPRRTWNRAGEARYSERPEERHFY